MAQSSAMRAVDPARFELLKRERGMRRWRVTKGTEVFYVVICQAWDDDKIRWLISPNNERWAEVSREELRRYLKPTPP